MQVVADDPPLLPQPTRHAGVEVATEKVEALAATREVASIDRRVCRRSFEQRFTARRMVERHVSVYREVVNARATQVQVAI